MLNNKEFDDTCNLLYDAPNFILFVVNPAPMLMPSHLLFSVDRSEERRVGKEC